MCSHAKALGSWKQFTVATSFLLALTVPHSSDMNPFVSPHTTKGSVQLYHSTRFVSLFLPILAKQESPLSIEHRYYKNTITDMTVYTKLLA